MEQKKIDRINFLARQSRIRELTSEEKEEQALLRQEYRDSIKLSLTSQLDCTYILQPDGESYVRKQRKQ